MSSILLANSKHKKQHLIRESTNNLDSIYSSNISGKMNIIEKNQVMQQKNNSGFFNQFDDLRFDTIAEPVGINEAFTTITGINSSLQRNLDFQSGYSQFQKDDMHYNVVDKDNFTHGNMIPSTTKRDLDINSNRTSRKLENFTGSFEHYKPKKEGKHLFEPMTDMTYINGMPAITDTIKNRYLPSNKNNNGNLPFETNVRVLPGLDDQNRLGSHSVYRILPKNVDMLRSDINQKISYESKPIEAIKKGGIRGPDPILSKFKMPDFRETKYEDLLPSRSAIEAPKKTGKYTNIITMRNETDTYNPINAVNTNIGDGPNKEKVRFEPSKKENYLNDNTHSITSVYNKPVMTNIKSFNNYDNQRTGTNIEYEAPIRSAQTTGYTVDYKNVPLTTARELMIHNNNIMGLKTEQKSYVFSNDMILPVTKREINNTNDVTNITGEIKQNAIYNYDKAKETLRQNTNHNYVTNITGEIKQNAIYNYDKAKETLRQNTNHNDVTNITGEIKQNALYNNDKAKETLRQTTNHNDVTNITGEIKQNALYNNDKAKGTLRQTTNYDDVTNITGEIKQNALYNNDKAKGTLRQTTNYDDVTNITGEIKQNALYNNDKAKGTLRQTTNYDDVTNIIGEIKQNALYNNDKAKETLREGTNYNIVTNVTGEIKHNQIHNNDIAKPTIKQTTLVSNYSGTIGVCNNTSYARDINDKTRTTIKEQTENNQHVGHANAINIESIYVRDLQDKAKPTIRQQIEATNYTGVIKSNDQEGTYIKNYNDIAKPTIKQTTIVQTPGGRVANSNMGNYTNLTDAMKTTTKETTLLEDYTGGLHGEIDKPISHDASNNMFLDDRRELSMYNRAPNGKRDINGPQIDKDNVRLNDPIIFNYVPQPHKSLDHSVMPTVSKNIIEQVYSMSKPVIESSSYYINPYFINTLNDNPYVNDIYHQKNV